MHTFLNPDPMINIQFADTCWIDTDEEVPGSVHQVEMVGVVDPAYRTGEHKAKVEVTLVLIKQYGMFGKLTIFNY